MTKYVVTDLTRFGEGNSDVCVAVIDPQTGQCFRPMPYLKSDDVRKYNIHPGAILSGTISLKDKRANPHLEDSNWNDLSYVGKVDSKEFKSILEISMASNNSVADGFGADLHEAQKCYPENTKLQRSIVTISIHPRGLQIHEDKYKPGKIKASFTDGVGQHFGYLAITDRGFYDYAKMHFNDGQLNEVRNFISNQKELFLRIGLTRAWAKPNESEKKYWMQVNGIYTFPKYFEEIRSYV